MLRVERLVVDYPVRAGRVQAVSDVTFDVAKGQTLGLVGESGCGKSTTARAILQMPEPTSGSVYFHGVDLTTLSEADRRRLRPKLQLIVQDAVSALNPRRPVLEILAEPFEIWGNRNRLARKQRIAEVLESVGLDVSTVGARRPYEFSGGQCQRINIARALVMEPELLVCDEPVSALDVSVRAQILAVLQEAKVRHGLTMIFVGHDLAVVKNVSDRIAVMYLGKLCEIAPSDDLCARPAHPYTAALLDSVLETHPATAQPRSAGMVDAEMPSPLHPPSGCRFRTRCPYATTVCVEQEPPMRELFPGRSVACHHPLGETATVPTNLGSIRGAPR